MTWCIYSSNRNISVIVLHIQTRRGSLFYHAFIAFLQLSLSFKVWYDLLLLTRGVIMI